ncbi:hypothetical protein KCV00_g479, partial [Aureobasidium melanogenum]
MRRRLTQPDLIEKMCKPVTPSIRDALRHGDRILTKIIVDAWILLETSPLPQWDMSEQRRGHLSDLNLHDLLVCVVPLPKSDWLPGNNRLDYLAFITLNMYDVDVYSDENIILVAGEPASDKRSALNMLLWSIKARIAMKSLMTEGTTINPS